MANKERENFYRGSTLIVDNTNTSFVDLLELHLSRSNLSFEDFINQHQHQIYHLCYNTRKCCQCTPGYISPNNRILHYPQLEVLFDNYAKKPGHRPRNRSDFCCAKTKTSITTDLLDITLTRTLLVNFCHDVFWYSCLTLQSLSLETFLNQNKHYIYHLREVNVRCCQCPTGFIFPVTDPLLDLQSWKVLFNLPELPCQHHRMVPSDLVCTVSASLGIDIRHLSDQLSKVLLERCCPLRKTIEKLILIRNKVQGHAIKGRISDADYGRYKLDITSGIMEIAKVCKNEAGTKQSLSDVSKRSLDETLCIRYHDMMLEQIQMETRLEERIDDIAVQIPKTIEEAVSNAFHNKIPDIVEQSVQLTLKKLKEPNSILTTDQQRRKRKLIEDTFKLIKCYSSEDTFVETDVISMALTQLEDKGVIVLTGTAGAGKSRNSLEIIRRFSAGHNGYCGIKLKGICDWIDIINDNDCLVVLLDDIFGRTNCIFNAEDEKYFDNIHSMVVQGFVKVIFTMRNTIRSDPQVSDTIDRQRIFQKSRFIDLSSAQNEMKETQKRECLLKYCKLNNIGISDPYQLYDEKDFLDPLVPIYLSDQDIYEISNIDINPLMGYPESCFLFASNRKFTRLGIGFFKHPTQSLCCEIESLRNDGHNDHRKALEYAILVYMALNEDMLNLKNVDIIKFNRIYESLYHKKELTAQNICRGLKELTKRYLKTNVDGTYSFQHRSIFEGVLLSYNDIETDILIPLLHIDFIMEIGRLEGYKPQPGMENEITLLFKKDDYNLLAQKIIKELGKNILTKSFMERLCSSKVIRNADGYFLDELFKEYTLTKCEMCCRLHHLNIEKDTKFLQEKYVGGKYIKSKRTSVTFLICLFQYSIKYADNNNTICHILKLMERDLHVDKKNFINKTHEKCFTEAILQSCACLDDTRLNMIWKFMERNKIKLDTKSLLLYRFGLGNERRVAALKMLSCTVLTSDLIISNCILAMALEVDDTSLVELIFKRDGSTINVPIAFYNACARGAVSIVKWIFSNFPHREFNIEKALMLSCSNGGIEHMTFQYGCLSDTGDVALYLLNNFRTKTNNLDLAMHIGLERSSFNACKILMENTDNYFHADAVLEGIAKINSEEYTRSNKCFAFVQYLVTKYSCLNVDVLLQIAEHLKKNFDMVRWIMSRTDNKIFYTAWKRHQWIHKEICALQLIYETEFYKTLDLTGLIQEEITYGNNNCIRFLMEKVNVEKAEKIIVNRVCSSGDENLMQIMFEKFISLNIADTMKIALKHTNWEAVKWLCKNFDAEKLNVQAFMKEAINCGEISVIRYFTEIFDRKYFDSNAILVAIGRGASFTCFEIDDLTCLIKWYLQDIKNRYRINDMLKLSCMKEKKYTQEIFKVVFQNNKSEFLHLNIALTTLLTSRDFESLKTLLCNYDTAIFDMHFLMERIWDIFKDKTYADDITKWLLQHFDQISFDIPYILRKACLDNKLEFVQWMCGHYNFSNLTLESIFIYACKYSAISVIQWMFEQITLIPLQIDFKKVIKEVIVLKISVVIFFIQNFELDRFDIDNICKLYSEDEIDQLEFQLCIFEAYGSDMVDVKPVFDSVCRLSTVPEVKWFMNIVDSDLDVISGMKEALCGNNNETFLFLYESLNVIDPKEADLIFMKASYHGNLKYVQLFHETYGESLSISAAIKELCQNTSKTNKHFDVFKFLVSFSSPSIINCQSLLNQACYSGDIENITWLLDNFDPDLFEVSSAINQLFNNYLSTEQSCGEITLLLLNRCHFTSSDIQAVMETVCSKGMVTLMNCLVLTFSVDFFDFRRILSVAVSPINTEIYVLAFCQCRNSQIDLQKIIISACKTGGNETLMIYIFFTVMVGLDQHLVVDTIHTILDIRSIHSTDITNEVIKFLFMKVDSNSVDFTSILKKSYTNGRNALALWILRNINHSLIDIQETLHEICRKGDIDSIKYLLHTCNYANLVNNSCIHNAFSSGSFEMIKMLVKDFPHITIDTKIAMNNAASSGVFAVVQWLFYKYSIGSDKTDNLQVLEPILNLKLARSIFDLNSAMLNACRNGNTDVVQWLLQIFPNKTFDMKLSLMETSASGNADLVRWILAVYDNDIFDIETSLISACKNGRLTVVQLFIEKFGIDAFDMETITTEASASGNIELVEWLHEPVSCNLSDI